MQSSNITKFRIKALGTMFVALVVLGLFIVALGGHRFWEELNTFVVRFDTVQDLRPGRPVKYAGLNVGRVLDLGMDDQVKGRVKVVIGVDQSIELYDGIHASISQKGLVGDNYVLLTLSGEAGERLMPGAEIPSMSNATMAEVAAKVGQLVDELTPRITSIAEALHGFLNEENAKNVEAMLKELPTLVKQANTTMARVEKDIATVSGGLGSTMGNVDVALKEITDSWAQTMSSVDAEVKRAGDNFDSLSGNLEEKMDFNQEKLDDVLGNMAKLTGDLRLLSRSLRERPWQLLNKSEGRPME